jgi:hypothetical protein
MMITGILLFYLVRGFNMKSKISAMIGIIFGCIALSCDMFSPRTVESPGSGSSVTDPFRLYSILKYTGEAFSKTSYEDVFDSNFVFIDFNGASSSRGTEIEALHRIVASCKCDSINTVWDTCNDVGEIHGDHTLTLCRSYKVTFISATGVTIDSGKTQFDLRESLDNTWTIVRWNEEGQQTIFHP